MKYAGCVRTSSYSRTDNRTGSVQLSFPHSQTQSAYGGLTQWIDALCAWIRSFSSRRRVSFFAMRFGSECLSIRRPEYRVSVASGQERAHGLDGVVAKKRSGRYRPGQRGWIKMKNPGYWRREEERALFAR
jgi:hypothetical protein